MSSLTYWFNERWRLDKWARHLGRHFEAVKHNVIEEIIILRNWEEITYDKLNNDKASMWRLLQIEPKDENTQGWKCTPYSLGPWGFSCFRLSLLLITMSHKDISYMAVLSKYFQLIMFEFVQYKFSICSSLMDWLWDIVWSPSGVCHRYSSQKCGHVIFGQLRGFKDWMLLKRQCM